MILADRVWQLGVEAIPGDEDTWVEERERREFTGYDARARSFLQHPSLRPVVQFSCAVIERPYELALESALTCGTPSRELMALVLLVRVRAPGSVSLQWETLTRLDVPGASVGTRHLLAAIRAEFSADRLMSALRTAPPAEEFANNIPLFWAIRAAGVTRLLGALPRLRKLSVDRNLYTSLAAAASIEEFPGTEGEEALVACLLGWRYNAYIGAAHALLQRNPSLLRATLLAATPPERDRYQQGLFLARLDELAAVPILCETVGKYQIIDDEMFEQIGRLAQPEHLELIESLPGHVREEQREAAEAVLARVSARLAGTPTAPR